MTVTVDINVALDVFQRREPHFGASARVLDLVVSGGLRGVFPAHGLTTLHYLIRKHGAKADAEGALDQILRHFLVASPEREGWQRARRLAILDFEDAVVATVAEQTGSAFVVTRNTGDFAGSPVPAITPTDFLGQFTSAL